MPTRQAIRQNKYRGCLAEMPGGNCSLLCPCCGLALWPQVLWLIWEGGFQHLSTSGLQRLDSLVFWHCKVSKGCCEAGLLWVHRCFVKLVIFYVGGYESDYCYQNVYVKSFLSHIFASYTTCLTIKTFSTQLMIILSFPTLCSNIT